MLSRSIVLTIFVTSAMAAVSSQVRGSQTNLISKYKTAMSQLGTKKSCKNLKSLSSNKNFSLNELALIRYSQNCGKKTDWENIVKKISRSSLKPFAYRSQFDYEIKKKRFGNAYRIYNAHRSDIDITKKDFSEMAVKALKTRLTAKEKKSLRKELYRKAPRFIPKPKKTEYRKVARDYRGDRNFEKALHYYRKVINDPKMGYSDRWKAFRGARITYKLERWSRMKKYIKASKQWAEFLRGKHRWSAAMTKMHHDANIEYVRTLWTEKGQTQAKPVLDRLEKEVKGRYSLQMVYWLKGRMAEERKNYANAVTWLNKAAKERAITLRDRDRVLWSLAWNQRRIKKFSDSQKALDKLKKSSEMTFFAKTKYLYWQAENFASMGKKTKANEAFERLADFDPYGYYGALAFRKLKKPFPKPPTPKIKDSDLLAFFNKKDRVYFQQLVEAEEYEISEAFVLKKVKHQKSWSTTRWVNYLNLLQMGGAYKSFFIRYHSLPPKKQLAVLDQHPYLLFPQPYKKQVVASSKTTKVSPALIYSIMKQESGFDVKARSHADAFGLLQLIPQVAKKASQRMPSISYNTPYDLFKPEVIIPLGANNLHHLFSRFNSNFILSVASYNASEQAVKGWIKSRFQGDPITFIEDIPYEETKGYVKLVMRNYITYNRFDDSDDLFHFPEVCLQGLGQFKDKRKKK